jgi:hypothetical protein
MIVTNKPDQSAKIPNLINSHPSICVTYFFYQVTPNILLVMNVLSNVNVLINHLRHKNTNLSLQSY